MKKSLHILLLLFLLGMAAATQSLPEQETLDTELSSVTVRAFKAGLFSFAAHDHEIRAPLTEGEIRHGTSPSVRLRFDARRMTVLDPKLDADKRAEVQKTMLSDKVLDSANFPEIAYASTAVTAMGENRWRVQGELSLHGQTRSVSLDVVRTGNLYTGAVTIRQTDFGITPISIAGGSIKVKNDLKIEFRIAVK